jgi:hypothetical protein
MAGSFKKNKQASGSIKGQNSFNLLGDYQLLKKIFAPWRVLSSGMQFCVDY